MEFAIGKYLVSEKCFGFGFVQIFGIVTHWMTMTLMMVMMQPGNELIIRDAVDHDVFAAEVQPRQLPVQTANDYHENHHHKNHDEQNHDDKLSLH